MDDSPVKKNEAMEDHVPVVEEKKQVAKPAAVEKKEEKKEKKVSGFMFCDAFKKQFPTKEPSDEQMTEWLQQTYTVSSFYDLNLGKKWRKFIKKYEVSWKDGVLNCPSTEEIKGKLKKQVEFYFSDGNLPKDNFLLEIMNNQENEGKWVNLSVLLTFKLIQKWCEDASNLADALSTSTEVELSEDKTKLRRKRPLTLTKEDLQARTTTLMGVPPFTHQSELRTLLSSHGTILAIFIKKFKPPKTNAEVIWETVEAAKKFAEQKTIMFKTNELDIKLTHGDNGSKKNEDEEIKEKVKHVFEIKNLPENTDWKNLKQWMGEKELDVKFIKLDQNTKSGHVRLGNNLASEAVSKLNGQTYEEKILEVSEIPENEQKMIMEKLKPDKGKKRGRGKDNYRKGGKRRRFN